MDLRKEFFEMVDITRQSDEDLEFTISQTFTGSIWRSIPRGHKWIHYFPIYDQVFSKYRGKEVSVLEIGVYFGASLKLWKRFFGHRSVIVGVDINSKCKEFEDQSRNIFVEVGSQCDNIFIEKIVEKYGPFDIIIDDGSHVVSHQKSSFNSLFLSGLKDFGTYWIEDLEGNYWDNGLKDSSYTTVDMMKYLIDYLNEVYNNHCYEDFLLNSESRKDSISVPRVSSVLHSISFFKGAISIEKAPQGLPLGIHI